ncbi:hypothetical protein ACL598_08410 [Bordetella bronchialis]|uniref:hypothetical protein n=1 Tax=Bordetella bronchialis TaxID=463025 RepID=UPI003CFE7445
MNVDRQRGQAAVEALAGMALLGLLATAAITIGRFQWQGLQAAHAARSQAFRHALGERAAGHGEVAIAHPAAPAGHSGPVRLRVTRAAHAADFPGPGGPAAAALRHDFGLADRGMVHARASIRGLPHPQHGDGLVLHRHTAILADAGHADGDAATQRRIAAARAAWAGAARASHASARQAAAYWQGLDQGWKRPRPNLDWLSPWSDLVPADRLRSSGRGAGRRR